MRGGPVGTNIDKAIVCSNGWDGVTAALQLVSHLEGDALNVALLVPESQRVLPGVLVSEHYGSPGRLAEYKRQFERASRSPSDDPSVFAIELETLAGRAFADVNASVRLQLVRIDSSPDKQSAPSIDISIVWGQILLCRTLWTVAACGRVMPRSRTVGEVARSRNFLGQFTRW